QSAGTEDIRCRAREVFQPKAGKEERRAAFRRRRRSGSIRCQHTEKTQGDRKAFEGRSEGTKDIRC
ncbi:unnamed protein product, partial [Effrenium voratum]